ncbi:nuclear fragile X mental retardation-interacting protein 1-like [Chelonus insularis]|uniref:nuclear fragile X mental retardation-interacting protein 1-like n=1 Tax=Chelonus insularis TaxID=460826 RepID=UPI00158845B6|nr:nuclear fragile X mental retardation-interacting protein 1-like [Chelonus insularis]
MSPLNRGPLLGPRMPPVGIRPPPPRFGRLPMPSIPPRMAPPPPMGGVFGPMRQRMPLPRPGSAIRPGPGGPPPLFGPRNRGPPPLMMPMMGMRGVGPRGPPMRPGPRGILPPPGIPHMRPRFPPGNGTLKAKVMNNAKKASKLEELELKKPWMTDEIRSEIQKKNKLYAKAKKNKDAIEWEEFKDLRNKVTRMIRDAKNEYLSKNPDQAALYQDDPEYCDGRDENDESCEEEENIFYCEMCDREYHTEQLFDAHKQTHRECGIDGCTFSAHPKLVEKHIQMQHQSGLYHRLKNLSQPEDIEKWRNERKRKYPTRANIESKNSEAIEKKERGEVINDTKKPKLAKKSVKNRRRKAKKFKKLSETEIKEVEPVVEMYRGIAPFRGTKYLKDDYPDINNESNKQDIIDEYKITDDEEEEEEEEEEEISLPKIENSKPITISCSLVADYASDSDNEPPDEIPITKTQVHKIEDLEQQTEMDHSTVATMDNIEIVETKTDQIATVLKENRLKRKRKLENENNTRKDSIEEMKKRESKKRKRPMLLQQLLSRSITHERNFICQCIKYIVDNNFFENKTS